MFNLLIDVVLKRILKERAKEATPKTGPIDFDDLRSLPGVGVALDWVIEMAEARRLDPNATITPPPFWAEAQETAGVTKQPLLCGMEITELIPIMTDFSTEAINVARFTLGEPMMVSAESLRRQIKIFLELIEEYHESNQQLTRLCAATLSKQIASSAFALMIKASAIHADHEYYNQWVEEMTFSTSTPQGDDLLGDFEEEMEHGTIGGTVMGLFPASFWNAFISTLNAHNLPIPAPQFFQYQPEPYFLPEYLPQNVGHMSWRVGDSYQPTYSGALLAALAWMIAERPVQLRNHLEELEAKGSASYEPKP